MKTLVFDNGAFEIKAGYSSDETYKCLLNCISKAKSERKRVFVSDQLKDCKDLSSIFFMLPFQKGYLVNFDVEKQIWDHSFGKDLFQVDFDETCLLLTEPHFNFQSIQDTTDEILFEDYQFSSVVRLNATALSAYNYLRNKPNEQCQLIVDVGYSFTHVVPYCRGHKISEATFRNSIGGKVLTNHLKEIISYRQLHVMEETYVINQCKEDTCFVSNDFLKDLASAKESKKFVVDYVLPDFTTVYRGFIRNSNDTGSEKQNSDEQNLRLNHERFAVPEMIFRPSDIGINEMGLSELIAYSINQCPEAIRPHLAKNIVLTGGCCRFSGFEERVQSDIRAMLPDDYDVEVYLPDDPLGYAWRGGQRLAQTNSLTDLVVTKQQYNEQGSSLCHAKFCT